MHTSGCLPRQLLVYSVICQNVTPRFKGEQVYIVQNRQKTLLIVLKPLFVPNACDLNNKKMVRAKYQD